VSYTIISTGEEHRCEVPSRSDHPEIDEGAVVRCDVCGQHWVYVLVEVGRIALRYGWEPMGRPNLG
jgi:hypothetical protein